MSSPSLRLIDFLLGLDERELAPVLMEHAMLALLDNVACGLYGAIQEWGRIVNDFVLAEGGEGRATLYGSSRAVASGRPIRARPRRSTPSSLVSRAR